MTRPKTPHFPTTVEKFEMANIRFLLPLRHSTTSGAWARRGIALSIKIIRREREYVAMQMCA